MGTIATGVSRLVAGAGDAGLPPSHSDKHDSRVDSLSQFLNWTKERDGESGGAFVVLPWIDPDHAGYCLVRTIRQGKVPNPELFRDQNLCGLQSFRCWIARPPG